MWNLRVIIVVILFVLTSCIFLPEYDYSAENYKDFGSEFVDTNDEQSINSNPTTTRSLADSPWPCEGGNAQRTGLSKYDTSDNPGKIKWKFEIGNEISESPVIGSDGIIYIVSRDSDYGYLNAINSNGTLKWKFKIPDIVQSSPTIASDGTIYIGSSGGYLYALNSDGTLKWKFGTGDAIISSQAFDSNGIIYVSSTDSYLYAINPDGTEKWKFKAISNIYSSPAISTDNTIYFNSGGCLYSINPNGTEKWNLTKKNSSYSSPAIGSDGTIYSGVDEMGYPSDNHSINAIYPNGTEKWNFSIKDFLSMSPPAIDSDGIIYVTDTSGFFYAINTDGTEKWILRIGSHSGTSPAIGADGTIYLGCSSYLYAINSDGSIKWKLNLGDWIESPAIGTDGTIYVTFMIYSDWDNEIYWNKNYLCAINKASPDPPRNLQVKETNKHLNLNWKVPIDDGGMPIKTYRIYCGTCYDNMNYLAEVDASITSYQDTNVINGQYYFYYVTAINEIGESLPSNKEIYPVPLLAETPWPMFQGNSKRTGLSTYDTSDNLGYLKWKYKTNGMISSSPTIDVDGTIFVGSNDYHLYAIYPNGSLKWKFKTGDNITSSPTICTNGVIYVGSWDGYLYAINSNGTLRWKFLTGQIDKSSPAIGSDGTIYIGSCDNTLYAINPSGTLKWMFGTTNEVIGSPAVDSNGIIYISTGRYIYVGNYLYAIFPNGTEKWRYQFASLNIDIDSSPTIGQDGTIYLLEVGRAQSNGYLWNTGYLYAINPDGTLKWQYISGTSLHLSAAIGSSDTIYFGGQYIENPGYFDKHYLTASNYDGSLAWRFQTSSTITTSPAIGSDGTIYFGSVALIDYSYYRGYFYAINPDGTEKWSFQSNDSIYSSPAIGADGTIYFGSDDGYLYALGKVLPSPPEDLQATVKNGYVSLAWQPPNNDGGSMITEYRIYRDSWSINITDGNNNTLLKEINSSENSFIDTLAEKGQTYCYNITAINDIGESESSVGISITYKTIPTVPEDFQATAGDGYVNLSWEPPNDNGGTTFLKYRIYRSLNNSYPVIHTEENNFYYNDSSVENGGHYYYSICAVNEIGEGPFSDIIKVIPKSSTEIENIENVDETKAQFQVWIVSLIILIVVIAIIILILIRKKKPAGNKWSNISTIDKTNSHIAQDQTLRDKNYVKSSDDVYEGKRNKTVGEREK